LLTTRLLRDPELLDALVQPPQPAAALSKRFEATVDAMEPLGHDARMDAIRRFKRHEEFKILVAWLETGSLDDLQEQLTLLADCCIGRAARWHAPVPVLDAGGAWAVVGLGKVGGRELTVHSDLDLVFVYDGDVGGSDMPWQKFVERVLQ